MGDVSHAMERRQARLIGAWAALALMVSVVAYFGGLQPAAPRINVRWAPHVDDGQRAALELQFDLTSGEFDSSRTWSYQIADTTTANVEALIANPAVEDTHGIDRSSYAVENAPGPFDGMGLALLIGLGTATLAGFGVAVGKRLAQHAPRAPLFHWILAVFALAYILFFVKPVFLNADRVMASELDLPAGSVEAGIGMDIRTTIAFSRSWLEHGIAGIRPYNGYPPLAMLVYAALAPLPFDRAYALVATATLLSYVFVAFVFPVRVFPCGRRSPLLMLVGVTGVFSYGLRFEIERGQQNLIAMGLCYAAIALCHQTVPARGLSYALFSIATQLKVYPCILVLMLIDRWHALRDNVVRILMLGTASVALLFVLGPTIFVEFIEGLMSRFQASGQLSEITLVNHSIKSGVVLWARQAARQQVLWPGEYAVAIQFALVACLLACLGVAAMIAYRANRKGIDVHLLLISALCAILIPGISHDYTLPVLTGPFAALLLKYEPYFDRPGTHWQLLAPLLACSAAYACLLFSPYYKPPLLAHNMPTLMFMAFCVTWLSLVSRNVPQPDVAQRQGD